MWRSIPSWSPKTPGTVTLFPFYRQEIAQFEAQGKGDQVFWRGMLEPATTGILMRRHLMTLVRNRFFDSMAADMKALFNSNPTLYALMVASPAAHADHR